LGGGVVMQVARGSGYAPSWESLEEGERGND